MEQEIDSPYLILFWFFTSGKSNGCPIKCHHKDEVITQGAVMSLWKCIGCVVGNPQMLAHAIESRKGCREEECSGREMAGTVEKCPWVLLIFKVNPKWLLIACHFFQPAFNHLKRISGKN